MIVRSNIITRQDIFNAVDAMNVNVRFIYQARDGYMMPIREFTPRNFERGFEFFLAGSHYAASACRFAEHGTKAATWVEWGTVMGQLFNIDPNAEIGWYKGRDDFIMKTSDDYRIRHGEVKREDCPWLNA